MATIKHNKPPSFPRIKRAWSWLVGFIAGKHAAARVYAEGQAALRDAHLAVVRLLAECDGRVRAAQAEQRDAELQNSSLSETVKVRDREILLLQGEKAALNAQLELRLLEVEELNLWLERVRSRLNADIASEVAREQGTGRARPQPPSGQG